MEGIIQSKMLVFFALLSALLSQIDGSLKWLAFDQVPENEIWNTDSACQKKYGFTGKQIRFCKQHFKWMKLVQDTTRETKDECQEEFKDRKWNCRTVNKAPHYEDDISKDTKESGFLYALSSAALALSVSRGCMQGNIPDCRCNLRNKPLTFPSEVIDKQNLSYIDQRLGCKGIMKVGHDFSKLFVNLGFRRRSKTRQQMTQSIVRKHNVAVGLKAISGGEEISCVCNGATAGCVVKYCYRRLIQLQEVSERLFRKYNKAVEATYGSNIRAVDPARNNDISPTAYYTSKDVRNSILFGSTGPDHCQYGQTSRRRCEIDINKPNAPNNCNRLCCGRGYKEEVIETVSSCKCEFVYCCSVKCQTCRSTKTIYMCN